jgi:hypothetical protein
MRIYSTTIKTEKMLVPLVLDEQHHGMGGAFGFVSVISTLVGRLMTLSGIADNAG